MQEPVTSGPRAALVQEVRVVVEETMHARGAVVLKFEVAKLLRNHPHSGMDQAAVEREVIRLCVEKGVRIILS